MEIYKSRLVATGFHQTLGATIRLVLSIALMKNWVIEQWDVNNTFLNKDLLEKVCMAQPERFEDVTKPNHVSELVKALYGLKQVPTSSFEKLKSTLVSQGFKNQGQTLRCLSLITVLILSWNIF